MRPFFVILFAGVLLLVSCQSSQNTDAVDPLPVVVPSADGDTLNALPVFADDGNLDSLFRAQGYLYGKDIVDAARSGSIDACYILAQMYAYGICGTAPNRREALKLYMFLAENNMPIGKAMAGYMLFYGIGQREDTELGLRYLVEASEENCGLAYYFLANFYSNNAPKTSDNIQNAKLCMAKAAQLGVVAAQREFEQMVK